MKKKSKECHVIVHLQASKRRSKYIYRYNKRPIERYKQNQRSFVLGGDLNSNSLDYTTSKYVQNF